MQIYGYIYAHLSTFMSIASNKLPVTIPDNFVGTVKASTIKSPNLHFNSLPHTFYAFFGN